MNVGVVGLGLIGGSLARAVKENTDHTVWGYDISVQIMCKARLLEAIDGELTDERIPQCDVIIIALYPKDTIAFLEKHACDISKEAVVVDTCGIKAAVCSRAWELAREHGFTFVGGHPMQGTERIGFEYSKADMFRNASMIFVPAPDIEIERMKKLKDVFDGIGFGHYEIATPEKHDRLIAYTSQLAHVLSSAYVKSPAAKEHRGFAAGSYRDMTRVAYLNEDMWTELFLLNGENLAMEIDGLRERLGMYSDAIKNNDPETLRRLLREGRELKSAIDAGEI